MATSSVLLAARRASPPCSATTSSMAMEKSFATRCDLSGSSTRLHDRQTTLAMAMHLPYLDMAWRDLAVVGLKGHARPRLADPNRNGLEALRYPLADIDLSQQLSDGGIEIQTSSRLHELASLHVSHVVEPELRLDLEGAAVRFLIAGEYVAKLRRDDAEIDVGAATAAATTVVAVPADDIAGVGALRRSHLPPIRRLVQVQRIRHCRRAHLRLRRRGLRLRHRLRSDGIPARLDELLRRNRMRRRRLHDTPRRLLDRLGRRQWRRNKQKPDNPYLGQYRLWAIERSPVSANRLIANSRPLAKPQRRAFANMVSPGMARSRSFRAAAKHNCRTCATGVVCNRSQAFCNDQSDSAAAAAISRTEIRSGSASIAAAMARSTTELKTPAGGSTRLA